MIHDIKMNCYLQIQRMVKLMNTNVKNQTSTFNKCNQKSRKEKLKKENNNVDHQNSEKAEQDEESE